jgi:hypothetical protein
VDGPFEHGSEPSGSIKCWEILEWLRNWRLLKKGSAPWSRLISYPIEWTKRGCVNGQQNRPINGTHSVQVHRHTLARLISAVLGSYHS